MSQHQQIAIVGGGVAGLACARRLNTSGLSVHVFDKGRGPGGRLSTRRISTAAGEAQFDHGAQYFTVRNPTFQAEIDAFQALGHVAPWKGRIVAIDSETITPLRDEVRWVGTPGMNGLVRGLAQSLPVQWGVRVASIAKRGPQWTLTAETGDILGHYDAVVVATPAEQAGTLLDPIAPHLAAVAHAAHAAPCWAGLFAFDAPLDPGFDGAKFANHQTLGWIACNSSKPDRSGPETWVVHANPAWSAENLEREAADIAHDLAAALAIVTGSQQKPTLQAAHRWRYAQTDIAAGSPYSFNAQSRLATCGDWHLGARVELAWQSGHSLGEAMAQLLGSEE